MLGLMVSLSKHFKSSDVGSSGSVYHQPLFESVAADICSIVLLLLQSRFHKPPSRLTLLTSSKGNESENKGHHHSLL